MPWKINYADIVFSATDFRSMVNESSISALELLIVSYKPSNSSYIGFFENINTNTFMVLQIISIFILLPDVAAQVTKI